MTDLLSHLAQSEGVEARRQELGRMLGLEQPVSDEVLYGALADPTYAHNLLVTREQPIFLRHLLDHPPRRPVVYAAEEAPERPAEASPTRPAEISNTQLLQNAGSAFLRWARSGFGTVDEATLQRRLDTCSACPNLTEPVTHQLAYKAAGIMSPVRRICGMCGCPVDKKAKLPTESCPDAHPTIPGMTRWGEPMVIR